MWFGGGPGGSGPRKSWSGPSGDGGGLGEVGPGGSGPGGGQHFALSFISRPSFCFCFFSFRGLSWNCGGLCAFSSLKMSSQHTFEVLWTSCETPAATTRVARREVRVKLPLFLQNTQFASRSLSPWGQKPNNKYESYTPRRDLRCDMEGVQGRGKNLKFYQPNASLLWYLFRQNQSRDSRFRCAHTVELKKDASDNVAEPDKEYVLCKGYRQRCLVRGKLHARQEFQTHTATHFTARRTTANASTAASSSCEVRLKE